MGYFVMILFSAIVIYAFYKQYMIFAYRKGSIVKNIMSIIALLILVNVCYAMVDVYDSIAASKKRWKADIDHNCNNKTIREAWAEDKASAHRCTEAESMYSKFVPVLMWERLMERGPSILFYWSFTDLWYYIFGDSILAQISIASTLYLLARPILESFVYSFIQKIVSPPPPPPLVEWTPEEVRRIRDQLSARQERQPAVLLLED